MGANLTYKYRAPVTRVFIIAATAREAADFGRRAGLSSSDFHIVTSPIAVYVEEKIRTAILLDSWVNRDDFIELNAALIERGIVRTRPCQ